MVGCLHDGAEGASCQWTTLDEAGLKGYDATQFFVAAAPAATPAAVVNRLNTELNAVLTDPAVRERLGVLGIEPTPGTPEQFRQQMQKDLAAYGPIVKAAGIKLE